MVCLGEAQELTGNWGEGTFQGYGNVLYLVWDRSYMRI